MPRRTKCKRPAKLGLALLVAGAVFVAIFCSYYFPMSSKDANKPQQASPEISSNSSIGAIALLLALLSSVITWFAVYFGLKSISSCREQRVVQLARDDIFVEAATYPTSINNIAQIASSPTIVPPAMLPSPNVPSLDVLLSTETPSSPIQAENSSSVVLSLHVPEGVPKVGCPLSSDLPRVTVLHCSTSTEESPQSDHSQSPISARPTSPGLGLLFSSFSNVPSEPIPTSQQDRYLPN